VSISYESHEHGGVVDGVGVGDGVLVGVTDAPPAGLVGDGVGVNDAVLLGVTDAVLVGVTDAVLLGVTDAVLVGVGVTDFVGVGVGEGQKAPYSNIQFEQLPAKS
jgi:hypothetical protein